MSYTKCGSAHQFQRPDGANTPVGLLIEAFDDGAGCGLSAQEGPFDFRSIEGLAG